jgi:hypothetical protein
LSVAVAVACGIESLGRKCPTIVPYQKAIEQKFLI